MLSPLLFPQPLATPPREFEPQAPASEAPLDFVLFATDISVVGDAVDDANVRNVVLQASFQGNTARSATATATLSDGCNTLLSEPLRVQAGQAAAFAPIDARSLRDGPLTPGVRLGGTVTPGVDLSKATTAASTDGWPPLLTQDLPWRQFDQ